MDPLEVLTRARELIKKGHSKDWYSRSRGGNRTNVMSDKATHFCAHGAICRVLGIEPKKMRHYDDASATTYTYCIQLLKDCNPYIGPSLARWNDSTGVYGREVIQLYTNTIEFLRTS